MLQIHEVFSLLGLVLSQISHLNMNNLPTLVPKNFSSFSSVGFSVNSNHPATGKLFNKVLFYSLSINYRPLSFNNRPSIIETK